MTEASAGAERGFLTSKLLPGVSLTHCQFKYALAVLLATLPGEQDTAKLTSVVNQ